MSRQEIDRLGVIKQIVEKRLKQKEGAECLGLTDRQTRRLVEAFIQDGPAGLVSKRRGRISNNHCDDAFKNKIKGLVEKNYHDFGPSFAAEKLREKNKLKVSKETLRKWMIEWKLWSAKRQKKVKIHQHRERRACFGELIQIDGSPHDWFEGRAAMCCLLVFIDDATSELVGLRFEETETTAGYFKLSRDYMEKEGRPLSFYSDKYGVFRVNQANCEDVQTQFGRAMSSLGIELICANSPQAKGRVERVNHTLQQRLVKEMRLRGINNIEAANAYLPEYMEEHNSRFAVEPRSDVNAHRKDLPCSSTLDLIFSYHHERIVTKNLEINFKNTIYRIVTKQKGYRLRNSVITVCEDLNGVVTLLYKGKALEYREYKKQKRAPEIAGAKEIDSQMERIKMVNKNIPAPEHPWRRWAINPEKAQKIGPRINSEQQTAT